MMNVKLFLQSTLWDGHQHQLDMSGRQETDLILLIIC